MPTTPTDDHTLTRIARLTIEVIRCIRRETWQGKKYKPEDAPWNALERAAFDAGLPTLPLLAWRTSPPDTAVEAAYAAAWIQRCKECGLWDGTRPTAEPDNFWPPSWFQTKANIGASALRHAGAKGEIGRKLVSPKRFNYSEADARRRWPDRFPANRHEAAPSGTKRK